MMKVELALNDAETIKEYRENGVCVVRNLMPPETSSKIPTWQKPCRR